MIRDHQRGLLVLAVGFSCWAAGASPALAQTGPSGSGSIAQTQYDTPKPDTTPPLVPPPAATTTTPPPAAAPPAAPAPEQEVLPITEVFEPDIPADAPDDDGGTAPDDAAGAPTAGNDDSGEDSGPSAVAARETGASAAPAPAQAQAGSLPFTGGLALPIAGAGLLLLGAGAALRRRTVV